MKHDTDCAVTAWWHLTYNPRWVTPYVPPACTCGADDKEPA